MKTGFESDVSLRNYREKIEEIRVDAHMHACVSLRQLLSDVPLAERFLYDNKLILIYATTRFYVSSR